MIKLRHQQQSLWEGLFAEEVAELWELWMRVVDELLEDEDVAGLRCCGEEIERLAVEGKWADEDPVGLAGRLYVNEALRVAGFDLRPSERGCRC